MINIVNGDILKATEGILVHGCNAMGVMGSGVALSIRNKYPKVYEDYIILCNTFTPQRLLGLIAITPVSKSLIIISGITQLYYGRQPSVVYVDYNAIKAVFKRASETAQITNLPLIFPKIGAGLAGGDWKIIEQIIEESVSPDVKKTLYIP